MPPHRSDPSRGPRFVDAPAPDPLRGSHDLEGRLDACLQTLLPALTAADLGAVRDDTRILALAAGASLRTPPDTDTTAALVLQGRLHVGTPDGDRAIGPGATLQLRALLAPKRWPVRVIDAARAARPTRVALLPRARLASLARAQPALAANIVGACDEECSTGVRPAASDALDCTTIALVALSGAPDVGRVKEALRQRLAPWGSVASGDLARSHVRSPSVRSAWTHYVSQQELTRRFVITAPSAEADVDAALGEADRVVLLAGPDPGGMTNRDRALLWRSIRRLPGTVHLALLHEADSEPDGRNVVWARHALVDLIHNLRGDEDGYARLARFLAGRASALVLTGRQGRAWAGLGVLQELEQRGRAPDLLCGVGDGAAIARLYARRRSAPQTLRTLTRSARRAVDLLRPPTEAEVRARLADGVAEALGSVGDLASWQPCITLDAAPPGVQSPGDLPSLLRSLRNWCPQERIWLVKTREGTHGARPYLTRAGAGHRTLDIRLSQEALRDVRAIAAASRAARAQATRGLTQELPTRGRPALAGWGRKEKD